MQALSHSLLLLFSPVKGWSEIARESGTVITTLITHTIPLALIPAVCWYIGVTLQGWQVAGETMRLTTTSAAPMCVLFYLAMVGAVVFLGIMVHWMSATYHAGEDNPESSLSTSATARVLVEPVNLASAIRLTSYMATPFFLAGFLGLYPLLWLDLMIGTAIAAWCVYLLYVGIPIVLHVPPERGFLYASAVLAVALVAFVGLLTVTVLLWEFGPTPEYTY